MTKMEENEMSEERTGFVEAKCQELNIVVDIVTQKNNKKCYNFYCPGSGGYRFGWALGSYVGTEAATIFIKGFSEGYTLGMERARPKRRGEGGLA